MWSGILAFLNTLFRAITVWETGQQRDADRQAGRDSETTAMQWEVIKRAKLAKDIRSKHRSKRVLPKGKGDSQ